LIEALQYEHNRLKFIRVQRLMNIRIVKAFRTSSEALCILTGMTPIIIKTQEAIQKYIVRKGKGSRTHLFDNEVELNKWPHTAEAVKITESKENNEQTIQVYTLFLFQLDTLLFSFYI